jgi:YfiH family protein
MSVPHEQSTALAGLPGIRHAFFGRRGGVSTGTWSSLNVSEKNADRPEYVRENRALAVTTIGNTPSTLATLNQVHSVTVMAVTRPPAPGERPEADALVSDLRGITLGILTADCCPVLLADHEAGVIGAFHAGWKGAIGGIAQGTVLGMVSLGADPARIVAAIGPTISQRNYEVGPEFAANLLAQHRDAGNRISVPPGGKEHFDLPGFVFDQLHDAGIGLVEDLALCTYADPRRYFSHRYATHRGTQAGRQIAVIGLA